MSSKYYEPYKMPIQANMKEKFSLTPLTEEELSHPQKIETINFPRALQELIMSRRDDFIEKHPNVLPNVLVIQNDVLCTYQFPREIIEMQPKEKPEWFQKQYLDFLDKLEAWEGQLLFEWMGLKIYNRWHVLLNRDNPFIFLEV